MKLGPLSLGFFANQTVFADTSVPISCLLTLFKQGELSSYGPSLEISRSAVDSSTDNDVIAVPAVLTYGCVQVTSSC